MCRDFEIVWNRCLQLIQGKVSEQSFKTWFKPIVPKKLVKDTLTIQVPSQFFCEWLEEHYLPLLQHVIHKELGTQGKLEYAVVVDQSNAQQHAFSIKLASPHTQQQGGHYAPKSAAASNALRRNNAPKEDVGAHMASHLNPSYTFDTFIEGGCNQLARSAAQAIAKKPGGTSFNPLMIYGGVGLGKTHIVQALGNEMKAQFSDKFVLYTASEQFTTQFIDALRNNSIREFSHFYLQADLLIIDDVQFLAGKEKTQEIFFHIFNHLHQAGKQIVMTSDCSPRQLKGLQERLISRFKWGLTADLQRPDFETRVAIIQSKVATDGLHMNDELVQYVAHSVDTNVRELEGVVISLLAHAALKKEEVNLALARQVLKDIVQEIHTEVSIDYIQKAVANHYSITPEDLKSKSRKKELVVARQVAMYFSKQYTNHSLKSIGHYFGGRDHSTVIHALQAVSNALDTEPHFKVSFNELQQKIKLKVPL